MSTGLLTDEVTESAGLTADLTGDSCRLEFIEIVPLTSDTADRCTTEYDSADCPVEVKQEILPVVKQERDDMQVYFVYCLL